MNPSGSGSAFAQWSWPMLTAAHLIESEPHVRSEMRLTRCGPRPSRTTTLSLALPNGAAPGAWPGISAEIVYDSSTSSPTGSRATTLCVSPLVASGSARARITGSPPRLTVSAMVGIVSAVCQPPPSLAALTSTCTCGRGAP